MTKSTYNVFGIGNAIVDMLVEADDSFLSFEGLEKGSMKLVNEETAINLCKKVGPITKCSGGSAANTIAGIASLGDKAAFSGRVRNDYLGDIFVQDIESMGVLFGTPLASIGPATASCIVFITPDGERTMVTYLGACIGLTPEDVDATIIAASEVTYLEGYLWDSPAAKDAFLKAAELAHAADRKIALSLSDSFCVERHRKEFQKLVKYHTDILFANEEELKSLYEVKSLSEALAAVQKYCNIAVITCGPKGSVVVSEESSVDVPVTRVSQVVDTTGAGDAYAAGFLHGFTNGYNLVTSGHIGSICASEIISHIGARATIPLSELVKLKLK